MFKGIQKDWHDYDYVYPKWETFKFIEEMGCNTTYEFFDKSTGKTLIEFTFMFGPHDPNIGKIVKINSDWWEVESIKTYYFDWDDDGNIFETETINDGDCVVKIGLILYKSNTSI